MKKIGFVALLCAVIMLAGCVDLGEPAATALPPMEAQAVSSLDELYEIYNMIDFNMTAAELEAAIGPAYHTETATSDTTTNVSLRWERNGIITSAAFEDNLVVAKSVDVTDPRVLSPLTPDLDFSKVHTIEVGATYSDIVDIMGYEGVEVMRSIDRSATPITQRYLMTWTDANGSVMRIYFNQDGTIVESDTENGYYTASIYEFPTIEPGATYAPTPTVDPEATPNPTAILTKAPETTPEVTEAVTTDTDAETNESDDEPADAEVTGTEVETTEPTAEPVEAESESNEPAEAESAN